LRERYFGDIAEIIVLDNLSTDSSKEIAAIWRCSCSIENFSFGGSANVCAREARFYSGYI
jgi:hypothetical protein